MDKLNAWIVRAGFIAAIALPNDGRAPAQSGVHEYIVFAADGHESTSLHDDPDIEILQDLDHLEAVHVRASPQSIGSLVSSGWAEAAFPFGEGNPSRRLFHQYRRVIDDDDDPVHRRTRSWADDAVHARALRDAGLTGQGMRIGVLDSGVNPAYISANCIAHHHDFITGREDLHDTVGHGTFVVATIDRLLPDAQINSYTVYRMHEGRGQTFLRDMLEGIDAAIADGVDIINMSWSLDSIAELEGTDWQHATGILAEALERAAGHGIFMVTSTANNRYDGPRSSRWLPEGSPYVISVGATDRRGEIARFSDLDAHLFAPGHQVYTFTHRGRPIFNSGTSFAAPYGTVGLAAIIEYGRQTGQEFSMQEAYRMFTRSARRESSTIVGIRGVRTHRFLMLDYAQLVRTLESRRTSP